MSGLGKLFEFKSREQREREEREYKNKMFPLGVEETKKRIVELLRPFSSEKRREEEILFNFLVAKQSYIDEEGDFDTALYAVRSAAYKPTEREIKATMALVTLDREAESLESYPTAERLAEAMEKIEL